MDPDREALRRAIAKARHNMAETHSHVPCSFAEMMNPIVEAAERDLARLEGEKPKKASLRELVDAFEKTILHHYPSEHHGVPCSMCRLQQEAAAVLRAVGEFQSGMKNPATREEIDGSSALAMKLYRSLP